MSKQKRAPEAQEPLADGIVRRAFAVEFKAASIDEATRSVRVVASTEALDSHGENVRQNWILERYRKNPVVLWNHNRSSFLGGSAEEFLPIGSSSDIVSNPNLEATLSFVDAAANPIAERIWQGFRQGSLRAVSVGFRPGKVTVERDGEGDVLSITLDENELYEISVVPMGSNPEAVALSAEFNAKERAALIKRATAHQPESKNMDLEQMKAKLADIEAKLTQSEAKAIAETARADGLQAKLADAQGALQKANETIATVEKAAIEGDVDALIGKKLKPVQREDFVKLRTANPTLFTSVVAGLPDLKLAEETTPPDPAGPKNRVGKAGSPTTLLKNAVGASERASGGTN
jgi:HK97 family phage prohead protease